jgi:hypothetical protein
MLYAIFDFTDDHELGWYDLQVETGRFGVISSENAFYLQERLYPPSSISIEPDTAVYRTDFYMTLHSAYNIFQACDSIYLEAPWGSEYHPSNISHLDLETAELFFLYETWIDTGLYDLVIKCDYNDVDIRLDDAVYIMDYLPLASLDTVMPDFALQGWEVELEVCGQYTRFTSEVDAWLSQDGIDIFHADCVSGTPDSTCIKIGFTFPRDIPVGIYDLNTYDDNHGHLILHDAFEINAGEPYLLPAPVGSDLFCEGTASTGYYIYLDDEFSDCSWSLDPETAGTVTTGTDNSCTVTWNGSYTGSAVLTVSATGQFDSLFYSVPLEITVKEQPVLSFDYFSSGMKFTFVNTSTGGMDFEWIFSDGDTITSYNASHTFSETGVYVVTLRLDDPYCGLFELSDTIRLLSDDAIGSFRDNYALYPNPSPGIFTLECNKFHQERQQVWVTDLKGRMIFRKVFEPGTTSMRISLKDAGAGLYILNVRAGHILWKEQLIILKQ